MSKTILFSGQPIISQILKYISAADIDRTANKHRSDRYCKHFKAYDHLLTMIFATLSGCSSLREVGNIRLACQGKINQLGLNRFPKRSTIRDANRKRSSAVFASIYYDVYKK